MQTLQVKAPLAPIYVVCPFPPPPSEGQNGGGVVDRKNWTYPLGVGYTSGKRSTMVERRRFSPEFKARVVLELISGKKGLMEASREYGIKDTVLPRWQQKFIERA